MHDTGCYCPACCLVAADLIPTLEKERKGKNTTTCSHVLKDNRQTGVKQCFVLTIQQKKNHNKKRPCVPADHWRSHHAESHFHASCPCWGLVRVMRALGQQFGEGGNWGGWRGRVGESESSELCRAGYRACERKGRWSSEGVQSMSFLDATWWY